MPERFLTSDGALRDDLPNYDAMFGFGRRVCPGRHFAMDVVWLAIAHVLAVFKIEPVCGDDGKAKVPQAKFTPWLIRCARTHVGLASVLTREPAHQNRSSARSSRGSQALSISSPQTATAIEPEMLWIRRNTRSSYIRTASTSV